MLRLQYAKLRFLEHWTAHRSKWIAGVLAFCASVALGVLIGVL
jgi:hypothetical protein